MEEKYDGSSKSKYMLIVVLENFAGIELKLEMINLNLRDETVSQLDFEWACTPSLR